ncbi:unnamed protein product [Rotaria sp. Silwood2]|nr:unnamed protein product [Rotaria sp. Silwood2]CAF4339047.1 unnamed protein product [Rotaria sp. Silwood2]
MDDNKLLTLANGQSTVSRCGMIYVDPDNLGPYSIRKRWLNMNLTDRSNEKDQLDLLYDRYTKNTKNENDCSIVSRQKKNVIVLRTQVNIIVQLAKLFDSLFLPLINHEKKDQLELNSDKIHAIFLQSFILSFGVCLKQEKWNDLIPKYEHNRSKRSTELLVPAINTIRLGMIKTKKQWLIKSMIIIHQPVLFVGDTESSKTATILSYIDNFGSQYINTYGPKAGTELIIFLDDISMPKIDQYGTQ